MDDEISPYSVITHVWTYPFGKQTNKQLGLSTGSGCGRATRPSHVLSIETKTDLSQSDGNSARRVVGEQEVKGGFD